jgi:hypothetical protein
LPQRWQAQCSDANWGISGCLRTLHLLQSLTMLIYAAKGVRPNVTLSGMVSNELEGFQGPPAAQLPEPGGTGQGCGRNIADASPGVRWGVQEPAGGRRLGRRWMLEKLQHPVVAPAGTAWPQPFSKFCLLYPNVPTLHNTFGSKMRKAFVARVSASASAQLLTDQAVCFLVCTPGDSSTPVY